MEDKIVKRREYFPRVKEAREALKEQALDLLAKYVLIIDAAIAKGDLDIAAEHVRWLIEHTAAQDGERIIDPSAAKVKEIASGPVGSQIQIGIALNGASQLKELPEASIDAEVIKIDKP